MRARDCAKQCTSITSLSPPSPTLWIWHFYLSIYREGNWGVRTLLNIGASKLWSQTLNFVSLGFKAWLLAFTIAFIPSPWSVLFNSKSLLVSEPHLKHLFRTRKPFVLLHWEKNTSLKPTDVNRVTGRGFQFLPEPPGSSDHPYLFQKCFYGFFWLAYSLHFLSPWSYLLCMVFQGFHSSYFSVLHCLCFCRESSQYWSHIKVQSFSLTLGYPKTALW